MSAITTHILDVSIGRPAGGVAVTLEHRTNADDWERIGRGTTDSDGRLRDLLSDDHTLIGGTYRLRFDTGNYFKGRQIDTFYPEVMVVFSVADPSQHFHVPLLLSPYGYSTYRGS